jgi:Ala-tRNA(Pro) deacylase
MAATPEDLFARLAELGIATQTHLHPAVYTVDEARALRGTIPGAHSKNLFLKDKKGEVLLVSALEDADIDLKTFHRRAGTQRLSFGKPELLMELLGLEAGSVTPFGVINDHGARIRVILDERLMRHETLNFHPLTNEATTSISPSGLVAFLRACGHEPEVMDVA